MRRLVLLCILSLLASCGGAGRGDSDGYGSRPRHIQLSYTVAENMARQLAAKNYANIRIIKSSFIDIDNADGMSSAGRVYPEVIGSRLAQLGYEIVELKVRSNSIKISPQTGVMLLSFDKNELSKTYNASAALVGYYKHFPYDQQTMLYVRIINLEDNTIMASDDVGIKD